MRIAVFSDIHGNLAALEAVLADIERHSVDHIVCLGDLVALGPHPGEVVSRIAGLGCPVVQGNTDTWYKERLPEEWQPADERQAMVHDCYTWLQAELALDKHAYLLGLLLQERIGPLLCVHGSPRDFRDAILSDTPEEELAPMMADVPAGIELVVCGHTHVPMQRQVSRDANGGRRTLTIVNAGSVGMPTDGDPRPCYALLLRTSSGWQAVWRRPAYDVEAAVEAARQSGLPHMDAVATAWRKGRGLTP